MYKKNKLIKCNHQMTQKRRRPNNIKEKQIISTKFSPKIKSQQQRHQCIYVTVTDFFFFFF